MAGIGGGDYCVMKERENESCAVMDMPREKKEKLNHQHMRGNAGIWEFRAERQIIQLKKSIEKVVTGRDRT